MTIKMARQELFVNVCSPVFIGDTGSDGCAGVKLVFPLAGRYTQAMRDTIFSTLILSFCLPAMAQTVPAGWTVIKDAKTVCQLAVPADWQPFQDGSGAAVFHDPTTAIATVTSQPGQEFKPFSDAQLKALGVPKEKVFENSARRVSYQDRDLAGSSSYSGSVPGKEGTCSCHVALARGMSADIAQKILLSLGSVTQAGASRDSDKH